MKLSEKKDLYHRFLKKELDAAGLEEFFLLVENGEIDIDVMPDVEEDLTVAPVFKSHPMLKLFIRISVAASLLLIAGAGYLTYRRIESVKQQSVFTTVTVPVGSMKIITLTDHSVVTLVSGAVFKYPAAFSSRNRKVFLIKGKGFFEIAKDRKRPFTVYSAQLSTTALGTSFTVENYPGYQTEKVRLYTGKVKIGSKDKGFSSVLLSPGQQYSHQGNAGGKSIFDNTGDVKPYTESGELEFDQTGMNEALTRVASYYNVQLKFDHQQLKNYSISGKFRNEPLEDVLHTILFIHHLTLRKIPEGYVIMN